MKGARIKRVLSLLIAITLILQQTGFAQGLAQLDLSRYMHQGIGPALDKFRPLHLRYFSYDALTDNFQLLLDKGDLKVLKDEQLKEQGQELLKYFLIGITLPDERFWVNLRPDSEDEIIDLELASTDLGKVLLEADLQLKKDTALFTSPETPEGRAYWNKLYQKAGELFGSDNITIPTLTRPWIVPAEVIIRETADSAYVYKASLKVMLEQDHLSRGQGTGDRGQGLTDYTFKDPRLKELNEYSSQLIRQEILPKLTKEVNTSKKYASLRQVFYSLILSRWFKSRFAGKSGLYPELINKHNLTGLTSKEPWSKTTYFKEYQKSFQNGEYNIKEPASTPFGQVIRSYFSGGASFRPEDLSMPILSMPTPDVAASPIIVGNFSGRNRKFLGIAAGNGMVSLEGMPTLATTVPALTPAVVRTAASPITNPQKGKSSSSPLTENFLRPLASRFGLTFQDSRVVRIKGAGATPSLEELLDKPTVAGALGTALSAALGSLPYIGGGKDVRKPADNTAVHLAHTNLVDFVRQNTGYAVLILGDEGERDGSDSLPVGAIYYSGYEGARKTFRDADKKLQIRDVHAAIAALREEGVTVLGFIGDALEVTVGLADERARTEQKPTNSWAVANLLEINPDDLPYLIPDTLRSVAIRYRGPEANDLSPFDLPTVAFRKIAAARGISEGSPEYAEFVNGRVWAMLGQRPSGTEKSQDVAGKSHRHKRSIEDLERLKEEFYGLGIGLRGDGDMMPGVQAVAGIPYDEKEVVSAGRTGNNEAHVVFALANNYSDGRVVYTLVSNIATNNNATDDVVLREADIQFLVDAGIINNEQGQDYIGRALKLFDSRDKMSSMFDMVFGVLTAEEFRQIQEKLFAEKQITWHPRLLAWRYTRAHTDEKGKKVVGELDTLVESGLITAQERNSFEEALKGDPDKPVALPPALEVHRNARAFGRSTLATTSITGASADMFGAKFADTFKRITVVPGENTITLTTLLAIPDGVFAVETTLKAQRGVDTTLKNIKTALEQASGRAASPLEADGAQLNPEKSELDRVLAQEWQSTDPQAGIEYPDAVTKILAHPDLANEDSRVLESMKAFYNQGVLAGTGQLVILPIDQELEHDSFRSHASNPPGADPFWQAEMALRLRMTGYAASYGKILLIAPKYARVLPLIAKINNSVTSQAGAQKKDMQSAMTADIPLLARLGVKAIGFTIYGGSARFDEQYEELKQVAAEAKRHGMAVVVWSYPRGGDPAMPTEHETALDVTIAAVKLAVRAGANIVKIKAPSEVFRNPAKKAWLESQSWFSAGGYDLNNQADRMRIVRRLTNGRVQIFSGGPAREGALREIEDLVWGGAGGDIIGRNSFKPKFYDSKDPTSEKTGRGFVLRVLALNQAAARGLNNYANIEEFKRYAYEVILPELEKQTPTELKNFGPEFDLNGNRMAREYPDAVARMLAEDFAAENPDVLSNLERIYRHGALTGTGKLSIAPYVEGRPIAEISAYTVSVAEVDAALAGADGTPVIAQITPTEYRGEKAADYAHPSILEQIEALARKGVAALSYELNIDKGQRYNAQMTELRAIIYTARQYGLPVAVQSYPTGDKQSALDRTTAATAIAVSTGAQIIIIRQPSAEVYDDKNVMPELTKYGLQYGTDERRMRLVEWYGLAGGRRRVLVTVEVDRTKPYNLTALTETAYSSGGIYLALPGSAAASSPLTAREIVQNRILFGGNWKGRKDLDTEEKARAKAREFKNVFVGAKGLEGAEIVIFAEAKWVKAVAEELTSTNIAVGAQSLFFGDPNDPENFRPERLQEKIDQAAGWGARYVNVGHSMHRKLDINRQHREKGEPEEKGLTDEQANKIMQAILKDGRLIPWYTIEISGERDAQDEIADGINTGLARITKEQIAAFPITPEPSGKISTKDGTGVVDPTIKVEAQDTASLARLILQALEVKFGGSVEVNVGYGANVKGDNAEGIFGNREIRNALIGGASLEPQDFLATGVNGMKGKASSPAVSEEAKRRVAPALSLLGKIREIEDNYSQGKVLDATLPDTLRGLAEGVKEEIGKISSDPPAEIKEELAKLEAAIKNLTNSLSKAASMEDRVLVVNEARNATVRITNRLYAIIEKQMNQSPATSSPVKSSEELKQRFGRLLNERDRSEFVAAIWELSLEMTEEQRKELGEWLKSKGEYPLAKLVLLLIETKGVAFRQLEQVNPDAAGNISKYIDSMTRSWPKPIKNTALELTARIILKKLQIPDATLELISYAKQVQPDPIKAVLSDRDVQWLRIVLFGPAIRLAEEAPNVPPSEGSTGGREGTSSPVSSEEVTRRLQQEIEGILSALDSFRVRDHRWNQGHFEKNEILMDRTLSDVIKAEVQSVKKKVEEAFFSEPPAYIKQLLKRLEDTTEGTIEILHSGDKWLAEGDIVGFWLGELNMAALRLADELHRIAQEQRRKSAITEMLKQTIGPIKQADLSSEVPSVTTPYNAPDVLSEGAGQIRSGEVPLYPDVPSAASPVGGIDFRVINMITQPMGNFSGLNFTLPKLSHPENIDLDEELSSIQKMLNAGIMPSGERLKEYVAACYQKGAGAKHIDGIIATLIDICRMQEEEVSATPDDIKALLLIVDSRT